MSNNFIEQQQQQELEKYVHAKSKLTYPNRSQVTDNLGSHPIAPSYILPDRLFQKIRASKSVDRPTFF